MARRWDNGLPAESFVALAPVPAEYTQPVLDALRGAEIAGYVDLATRHATHQLFVDAEKRMAAADLIHAGFPEVSADLFPDTAAPSGRDRDTLDSAETGHVPGDTKQDPGASTSGADSLWDDLVARYYESSGSDAHWPDAENLDPDEDTDTDTDTTEPASDRDPPPGRISRFVVLRSSPAADDERDHPNTSGEPAPQEDDEGHFVPPPAPPLPRGDVVSRLAWGGLLGGPALWILMMLLGQSIPGWMALLLVAWFIGGFVVLVARMRNDRPPGEGPDNGAVV
ncbi:hypothetical protein RIF23_00165 [Lipingzhangella sp. LS1_29]|uniref:DUF308 domain-containing protein n=1 Tax=Lipingzhangella rawalii TaxID=2055835 RepID=A0ABU2H072_9ACTN|nr:hypothetical protein [Lipingzhangella rawalii]MDS1268702.1 hypothetical protein [Lipingzhangella rawalii]